MIAGAAYWKYRAHPTETGIGDQLEPILHRELFFKKNDDKSNFFSIPRGTPSATIPICASLFSGNIQFFQIPYPGDAVIHPANWSPDGTYFEAFFQK